MMVMLTVTEVKFSSLNGAVWLLAPVGMKQPTNGTLVAAEVAVGLGVGLTAGVSVAAGVGVSVGSGVLVGGGVDVGAAVNVAATIVPLIASTVALMSTVGCGVGAGPQALNITAPKSMAIRMRFIYSSFYWMDKTISALFQTLFYPGMRYRATVV